MPLESATTTRLDALLARARARLHALATQAAARLASPPRQPAPRRYPVRASVDAYAIGVLEEAVGDHQAAIRAYWRALADRNCTAKAAFNLANLLDGNGDVAAAAAAYRLAIDSRDEDLAPKAALHLGRLLERSGDAAGARRAYRRAIGAGDDDVAANARCALDLLDWPWQLWPASAA
ncbi:MAG: tetratricopeptide repeat protein [Solirubrobacteraceae bacterium]|jgi:tetratricopeptide (TPR) repeat protein